MHFFPTREEKTLQPSGSAPVVLPLSLLAFRYLRNTFRVLVCVSVLCPWIFKCIFLIEQFTLCSVAASYVCIEEAALCLPCLWVGFLVNCWQCCTCNTEGDWLCHMALGYGFLHGGCSRITRRFCSSPGPYALWVSLSVGVKWHQEFPS